MLDLEDKAAIINMLKELKECLVKYRISIEIQGLGVWVKQ
jgi:hypothetical protein